MLAGTKSYENNDLKVTVITSEISHEEETYPSERKDAALSQYAGADKKSDVPIKNRKPFKKVAKQRSRTKPKKGKKKGKKQNKKSR